MQHLQRIAVLAFLPVGCIPPGNSSGSDGGTASLAPPAPTFRPSVGVMTAPFEDNFDRKPAPMLPPVVPGRDLLRVDAGDARPLELRPAMEAPATSPNDLGPDWTQAQTTAWRIENGRLCGQNAKNHGVWLNRVLPPNARIEFDAISESPQGDLKCEVWGDGQSAATKQTYDNATSYIAILGGWKNTFHVLARINEHAPNRREIKVDPTSDDPRQRPVARGQVYHFRIERTDGRTVRWFVDGNEMASWADDEPLVGMGHDHFGFNDWEAKVCFDNVKVTPFL